MHYSTTDHLMVVITDVHSVHYQSLTERNIGKQMIGSSELAVSISQRNATVYGAKTNDRFVVGCFKIEDASKK